MAEARAGETHRHQLTQSAHLRQQRQGLIPGVPATDGQPAQRLYLRQGAKAAAAQIGAFAAPEVLERRGASERLNAGVAGNHSLAHQHAQARQHPERPSKPARRLSPSWQTVTRRRAHHVDVLQPRTGFQVGGAGNAPVAELRHAGQGGEARIRQAAGTVQVETRQAVHSGEFVQRGAGHPAVGAPSGDSLRGPFTSQRLPFLGAQGTAGIGLS